MRRKRKSSSVFAFAVFVVFILLGGSALGAAGYVDNPFDEIAFLSNWATGGESRFEQEFVPAAETSDFSLPSSDAATTEIDLTGLDTTNSQFQLPAVGQLSSPGSDTAPSFQVDAVNGIGSDEQNAVDLSDIGDVLYDFWFICATTAVFIVVQQVYKFTSKQVKSRRLPSAAAAK